MAQEYVGIDLHRRRSVIYPMDHAGDKIDSVRLDNEPSRFAKEISAAPVGSDVILEAAYGWYWAADLLEEMGYRVHLANSHGNDWGHRRVKNDERDARDLADLLRLGRLAEAWIAHSLELPDASFNPIAVLRDLVELYDREIGLLDRDIHRILSNDAGDNAVQAIYGVGRLRRHLRGRDRRRHPLRDTQGPVLVGGACPQAPRVRHPRSVSFKSRKSTSWSRFATSTSCNTARRLSTAASPNWLSL
jgi:transposase